MYESLRGRRIYFKELKCCISKLIAKLKNTVFYICSEFGIFRKRHPITPKGEAVVLEQNLHSLRQEIPKKDNIHVWLRRITENIEKCKQRVSTCVRYSSCKNMEFVGFSSEDENPLSNASPAQSRLGFQVLSCKRIVTGKYLDMLPQTTVV